MSVNKDKQITKLIDEQDVQAFNEQDYQAQETKGYESIQKDHQSTGQDRDRMSKMGLEDAKKSFHEPNE